MRKAIIEGGTGVVLNIIEYDDNSEWQPPDGTSIVDADDAQVNGTWDGVAFTPPPAVAPAPIPPSTQEQLDSLMALLVTKAVLTTAEAEAIKDET